MMEFAYTEELLLPEDCHEDGHEDDGHMADSSETAHSSASAGTFALRRAHYFNEAVQSGETGLESSLSAEQQQTLTRLIRNGNFDAKQKMITRNLRLVVDIARRYTDHGVPLLDLIREGNPGLIYALENFEVEDRICFSIYATQCIRQHIERAIMNQNNPQASLQTTPAVSPDNACPVNTAINTGGHDGHHA